MTRPALVILLLACSAAPAGADESLSPADLQFFESKVRPLLAERCQGCHSAKAKKQRGGLLLVVPSLNICAVKPASPAFAAGS